MKTLNQLQEVHKMKQKGTFQPNKRKRSKKHGFFARMKTDIIKKRRRKNRKVLAR